MSGDLNTIKARLARLLNLGAKAHVRRRFRARNRFFRHHDDLMLRKLTVAAAKPEAK